MSFSYTSDLAHYERAGRKKKQRNRYTRSKDGYRDNVRTKEKRMRRTKRRRLGLLDWIGILAPVAALGIAVWIFSSSRTSLTDADAAEETSSLSQSLLSSLTGSSEETTSTLTAADVLSGTTIETMEDGTLFDPVWYESELTDAGNTDTFETTTELYRHYQLYGQGEGYSAYDTSAFSEEELSCLLDYVSCLREELIGENSAAWLTVTADIYDSEEILLFNTEYTISDTALSDLNEALSLFDGYNAGFVLLDLNSGAAIAYRAGEEIYSASVIKAPYIFSLLDGGYEPTDAMYLAGNQSDNDAYLSLRETYGDDVFIEWLDGTAVPTSQGEGNYTYTTPLDLARMFYKGTDLILGDETYSEWARETFTDSLNSAMALTVGEEKSVYSKAGWISQEDGDTVSCYTNAAIVDGDNPYILVFMADTAGYTGLEYAQTLLPVLDAIHDDMTGEETYVSPEITVSSSSSSSSDSMESTAPASSNEQTIQEEKETMQPQEQVQSQSPQEEGTQPSQEGGGASPAQNQNNAQNPENQQGAGSNAGAGGSPDQRDASFSGP